MAEGVDAATVSGRGQLRGYSLPLTPLGRSSLVPPPPWHFSGDAIWISYRADPRGCQAFLPDRLRIVPDHANASVAFFDWQWCTDDGGELADPGGAQFRECLVTLDCLFDQERVARVPVAWVDSVVPLVRGLVQGMPKVAGSVHMSRTFPVGRATAVRGAGGEFHGTLSHAGRRTVEAHVRLTAPAAGPPVLATRPLIHTRHVPGWGPDLPEQADLVRSGVTDVEFSAVWEGDADLAFPDVSGMELEALVPVDVFSGYVFSYAETLSPGGIA